MGSSSLRSHCSVDTTIYLCLSTFDIGFLSLPCDLIRLTLTTSLETLVWPTIAKMQPFLQVIGHTEVSRDVVSVSLIKSQGSERKPMSKAERKGK